MADDSCSFFDTMMAKYSVEESKSRKFHHDIMVFISEVMVFMMLIHGSSYCCLKVFCLELHGQVLRSFTTS